jgi:thiamine pyrophosphokinase
MPAEGSAVVAQQFEQANQVVDGRWAVIVTGGSPLAVGAVDHVPAGSFVIAADSGLDHAIAAGITPDLVVGDLDSVSAEGVAWARARNIPFEVYPTDKDLTDTQIALGAAWSRQLLHVLLIGGGGDRLDHSTSALTALGHPSLGACKSIGAIWGCARVHVLHAPGYWEFDLAPATTFSLLALHGDCDRVTVSGAKWPLRDALIQPGSSLGVSNLSDGAVRVSVGAGVLTLLIPSFLTGDPS